MAVAISPDKPLGPSKRLLNRFVGDLFSDAQGRAYQETRQSKKIDTGFYEAAYECIKSINLPAGVLLGIFPKNTDHSVAKGLPRVGLVLRLEDKFILNQDPSELIDFDSVVTTGRYEILEDENEKAKVIRFQSDNRFGWKGADLKDFFESATITISGDPEGSNKYFNEMKNALTKHFDRRQQEEIAIRTKKVDVKFYDALIKLVSNPKRLKDLVVRYEHELEVKQEESFEVTTQPLVTRGLIRAGFLIKEKNIDKWKAGVRVYDTSRKQVGRYYPTYSNKKLNGGYIKYWDTNEKVNVPDPLKSNLLLVNPSLRGKEFRRILKEARRSYIDTFTSLAAKALNKKIQGNIKL